MRILPCLLTALATAAPVATTTLYLDGGLVSPAVLADLGRATPTGYVQAGIPFLVQDGYASQLCIATRSGRALPPFVISGSVPALAPVSHPAAQPVHAGIPFVVRDRRATVVCVSSRNGYTFLPFIDP